MSPRGRRLVVGGLVAMALLLGGDPGVAAPAEPLRPRPASGPLGDERLSDELRLSRWAHPTAPAPVRVRPRGDAARVATLRLFTEDRFPEVYLALRSRRAADGRTWIQVRLPMRPNGRTGWVPEGALGRLNVVTTALVIDRRRSRATLLRDGRRALRVPIGHGAPGTPTPAGRFYVRERIEGLRDDPVYGPLAFGTSAYADISDWPGGAVVGIHGTSRPDLIPGRPSHGCIRLRNADIRRLGKLMPVGTPVHIR
jgi:hypothetical protein